MPEQKSARGQPITGAEFTNPFETAITPYGKGGLDLNDALDSIDVGKFARVTNMTHTDDRAVTGRPGLEVLATGGTNHHSIRRLSDPQNSTYTRIWGTDQDLRIGQSGALTIIDTGYSGDPLYLLPHRPPLSGDPWMFVADRIRMRKVRADGLDLEIGLPAPGGAPTVSLSTQFVTGIAGFDPAYFNDGTAAPNWTLNAGFDFADPPNPVSAPTTAGNAEFIFNLAGSATCAEDPKVGWYASAGIAVTRDLSMVGGRPATDDDIISIAIRLSAPATVAEVRLYLVCSPNFDATVIPGTDANGRSSDFFMKSFRPDDFAQAVAPTSTSATASEAARIQYLRDQALQDSSDAKGYGALTAAARTAAKLATQAAYNPSLSTTEQAAGATVAFKEFGIVGVPLRRGEFRRFGQTANCDWNTITGLFLYYQGLPTSACGATSVALLNWFMTGGSGPDTIEPGAQAYDYRYTNYDPRTGAESNPSPEVDPANGIDSLRRGINVDPGSFGDAAVRQRIYRRGGSLTADWFFVGTNSSDGGVFLDELSDDEISTAGTVNLDHYQPVPTVNDAGTTVLAQPVPVIFGPANGLLFALGDPYRPGHLYWCIPDQPDHWPAESNFEVCSPSEELMAGLMIGAQPYCFSRERLYAVYPNLGSDQEVSVTTTGCKRGIVSRWAFAVGMGGVFGIARDCIFFTSGGSEEVISQDLTPLFEDKTVNGYPPIDFTQAAAGFRLSIDKNFLYFLYPTTDGCGHVLVYSLLYRYWVSDWQLSPRPAIMVTDEDTMVPAFLLGGLTGGTTFLVTNDVFSDNGTAITCRIRNGTWDLGRPREDKLLGDQVVDADPQGVAMVLQNRLDNETITNAAQGFAAVTGRSRFVFDSFGTVPQRARNISTEISWSSSTARPILYFLGQSVIPEPDVTVQRVTQWDDLGHPDESYLTGITLDVDTQGAAKTILVEYDFAGAISTAATLTVTAAGRRKLKFSWEAVQAHKIRLRPTDSNAWIVYRADWISQPEPPRIAGWDWHFEADGDQYYTGLDLYCDTAGLEKQIQVSVDGTTLTNPYTGEAFWRITANGRRWIHLTFLAGRGHVFHFRAIDANPGLLYQRRWYLIPEPSEQANLNAAYSVHGTLADKWFKSFLMEIDTFGITKSIDVDLDGTVVEQLPVNTTGRQVVHLSLTQQRLGRVLRAYATDGNPARPYTIMPIFDEEPYSLTRWQVQEGDDGIPGYKMWLEAWITLVCSTPVTLTMTIQRSQSGDGVVQTRTYTIPSTQGAKLERYVPFFADKGVKRSYLFTCDTDFRLYREESFVLVQPFSGGDPVVTHPFGNDNVTTPTRAMISPSLAAARSGGGSA